MKNLKRIIDSLADDPDPLVRDWAAGFGPTPWAWRLMAVGVVYVGGRRVEMKAGPTTWGSGRG